MMSKKEVFNKLQENKSLLTRQQYKTLIGQAKSGNHEGAYKGLMKLLNRGA